MINNNTQLIQAVRYMRSLQIMYFKTKLVSDLIKAKAAEKIVDDLISPQTKMEL